MHTQKQIHHATHAIMSSQRTQSSSSFTPLVSTTMHDLVCSMHLLIQSLSHQTLIVIRISTYDLHDVHSTTR